MDEYVMFLNLTHIETVYNLALYYSVNSTQVSNFIVSEKLSF